MGAEIKKTTSFSGRQLDLECLQSMDHPSTSFVEVTPSVTFDTPKIVSGPQKLAQRYAVLFTTVTGSDIMDPDFGTTLFGRIDHGNFGGYTEVNLLANEANIATKQRIIAADNNTDTYGKIPDDEKLKDSWISRVVVDKNARTIDVFVKILTVAGEDITFVVPTPSGIY